MIKPDAVYNGVPLVDLANRLALPVDGFSLYKKIYEAQEHLGHRLMKCSEAQLFYIYRSQMEVPTIAWFIANDLNECIITKDYNRLKELCRSWWSNIEQYSFEEQSIIIHACFYSLPELKKV